MQSSQPLVSVIISCYNHQDYITQCIESIMQQSYPNIELIVIDDGSTDNSAAIIQQLSEKYQFYFESQANMGLTKTLNKALAKAKGKYIAPLGSDDYLMLDKTAKQVQYLEQHPNIAVVGGNILVVNHQGVIKSQQRLKPYREVDFNTIFLNPKQTPAAPSVMIRAEVLKQVNGYNTESNLEDLDLWLRITHQGHKIAVLNDVFAYYRQHETNSYKNYQFMTESQLQIYQNFASEPDYPYVKNQVLIRMFLKTAKKDRRYALKIFKQISPKYYNWKVIRAWLHYFVPKFNKNKSQ